MSSLLKITTPFVESDEGNSRLSTFTFSGKKARKIFTFEYGSTAVGATSFTLTLSQGGTGSAFSLSPSTSGATATVELIPGQRASFSVEYDGNLGSGVTASLTSSSSVFSEENVALIGPTTSIEFGVYAKNSQTKRELGVILNVNEDGDPSLKSSSRKITQDETSFGLIRTNPKLTGNVKITVDSKEEIWLNSIDAVKDLSDDRFKKFRISPDSSYALDIKNFFDSGKTPKEIVYALYQADEEYLSTKRNFSEQYDRFYSYGAEQLSSKFYEEDFSFFAPLYLKTEIPDYFVIFRTDGPVNKFTYELLQNEWTSKVSSDILSNSKIVKTYDLSENSSIGRYLRRIVSHPSRREAEMTVSYQKNGYTTFNGISYRDGSFAQMGELLSDFIEDENPLIATEEFITLGFERNSVVSSHVLNLEFLFNDEEAENYSINRYFGLYVNAEDLLEFTVNDKALQQYSKDVNQYPLPRKGVDGKNISVKSFTQTNESGVRIYVDNSSVKRIPETSFQKMFSSVTDEFSFGATSFECNLKGDFESLLSAGETVSFSREDYYISFQLNSFSFSEEETALVFSNDVLDSNIEFDFFKNYSTEWKLDFYGEEKAESLLLSVLQNDIVSDSTRFLYLRDRDENLYSLKSSRNVKVQEDEFTQKDSVELTLKDNAVDISKFSGFREILTQTDCSVLDTKGKSSLQIEVQKYFKPNDFLEIRWKDGKGEAGYPLRWRIVANETELNPGDVWPTYSLSSDSEGEFFFTYFHPGDSSITLEKLSETIQNAFNIFTYKNFEVLHKSGKIFFRCTQEGSSSNEEKLLIKTSEEVLSVMDIPSSTEASVSFIGGTDRKRTRARISTSVAKGMLLDEYVSTKGSFSLAEKYEVLGKTISFSPYLDEPVYEDDKLVDFLHAEDSSVIALEDDSSEIQTTFDKKLTTYSLFRPRFGVLSVMPLRDFDTDFYSSEYAKSYVPELSEYFSRHTKELSIVSVTGGTGTYQCVFDSQVEFDSYPTYTAYIEISKDGLASPVLRNSEAQFLFTEAGVTATLLCANSFVPSYKSGDTVLLMPDRKHLYFSDDDLSKFKGFVALSSIVSSQDEEDFQKLENKWDPARFFSQQLNSEYDRLSENFLKTLVLKSRVVPYVCKWVSPQGKDVRDNPYRFNYHRSFGNTSFSPSMFLKDADPRFHTHEWPYLDSVPDNFSVSRFSDYCFSYFFEPLSDSKYDFSSLKKDWFSEYFTVGYPIEKYLDGSDYVQAKMEPTERYSFFNYEEFTEKVFTMFRGQRIQLIDIDSSGNLTPSSTKYNNYRFSAAVSSVEVDDFLYEDPIEYKIIVNHKWKFVLLKITVKVSNYRFPNGRLRYTDLYTLQNENSVAEFTYEGFSTFNSYEKLIGNDKKLSSPVNLRTYSSNKDLTNVFDYYDSFSSDDFFIENYEEDLKILENGTYSDLIGFFKKNNYEISANCSEIESPFSSRTLKLIGDEVFLKFSATDSCFSVSLPYISVSWNDYIFYHQCGGNDSLTGIRDRLSFYEISNVLQGISEKSSLKYEVFFEDGNSSSMKPFELKMIEPEKLERVFDFYPVPDTDKPSTLFSYENIGATLVTEKDLQSLYRYQGDFSPKFLDVLKFWTRESQDFTLKSCRDFLLSNTRVAEELKGFSTLKNQFYQKVSDNEVLSISLSSGYKPLYPLVNEIAIDKKDIFVWNSSWDNNFYRKYSSVSDYTEFRGTEEMKELKSFLGSKMMKVPKQYDLYQFSFEEFSDVKTMNSNLSKELGYVVGTDKISLKVDVRSRLLREMLGNDYQKAMKSFYDSYLLSSNILSSSEITSKTIEYLEKNILDLFEISEVKFYLLQTGDPGAIASASSFERPIVESSGGYTLTEKDLFLKKYLKKKDVSMQRSSNLAFSLDQTLDSRFYTSISVGVTVRRI